MKTQRSMLSGGAIKSILLFAFPIMLSSLLQYNYSLVDNIIVGRYVSTNALAAVGGVGERTRWIGEVKCRQKLRETQNLVNREIGEIGVAVEK